MNLFPITETEAIEKTELNFSSIMKNKENRMQSIILLSNLSFLLYNHKKGETDET